MSLEKERCLRVCLFVSVCVGGGVRVHALVCVIFDDKRFLYSRRTFVKSLGVLGHEQV